MSTMRSAALAVAAAIGGFFFSTAHAETFPYANDFSAAGLLNENLDEHWTHDGANGTFDFSIASAVGNVVSTSSVEITGMGTTDFVVKTRFTLVNEVHMALTTSTMGFGAFGSTSTFGSFYIADWFVNPTASNGGTLRILAQGDTSDFSRIDGDADAAVNGDSIIVGNTYELHLTGTYSSGTLGMTLALFDSAGNQLGTPATATDLSPLTGTYFGYRNRVITTFSLDVDFDNFSVGPVTQPLSGDFNNDGRVDAADYVVWRKSGGSMDDYNTWRTNFGMPSAGGGAAVSTVPEPGALVLALLALIAFGRRFR